MKKTILIKFLSAVLIAGIFNACSKEQKIYVTEQKNIASQLKFIPVNERIIEINHTLSRSNIVIVSWNEWGRTKMNCSGWGLCNATWFPKYYEVVINPGQAGGGASILEFDYSKNKYYFDVLLAAKPPASFNATDLALIIDSDIFLDTQTGIGVNLKINNGVYYYDTSMRDFGGYRFYLEIN